jgi:tetratricopeptide (TPR) repeat protein
MSEEQLSRYVGDVVLESGRVVSIVLADEVLAIDYGMGLYRLVPEDETRFRMEDSHDPVVFDIDADGRVVGVLTEQLAYLEAGAAVERGTPASAVAWVTRAADAFPESPTAHFNLARALHGTGRLDEAMDHLRIALDLRPGYRAASSYTRRLYLLRFAPHGAVSVLMLVIAWVVVRRARERGRVG